MPSMGRFVSRASMLARILSADCEVSYDQLIRGSRAEPPPPTPRLSSPNINNTGTLRRREGDFRICGGKMLY